jgi:hypothetical protein
MRRLHGLHENLVLRVAPFGDAIGFPPGIEQEIVCGIELFVELSIGPARAKAPFQSSWSFTVGASPHIPPKQVFT